MTVDQLKKWIKEGPPEGIFYLMGEEQFLIDFYANQFLEKCGKVLPEMNRIVIDGHKFDFDFFADAVSSFPVMAESKLIVIADLDNALIRGGGEKKMRSALENAAPGVTVLFRDHAKDAPKAGALENCLKKCGVQIVRIEKPKPESLSAWIRKIADEKGCRIDAADSAYLAQLCGNSMLRISAEMNKLCAFQKGGSIERVLIDRMVAPEEDSSWYAISNAVASHDYDGLMQAIQRLYDQGTDDVVIAGMIFRAYTDLRRGELALREGKSSAELAAVCGVSPYAAARIMRSAGQVREGETLYALRKCVELDQKIKTSGLNKKDLIYSFVSAMIEFQMRDL